MSLEKAPRRAEAKRMRKEQKALEALESERINQEQVALKKRLDGLEAQREEAWLKDFDTRAEELQQRYCIPKEKAKRMALKEVLPGTVPTLTLAGLSHCIRGIRKP